MIHTDPPEKLQQTCPTCPLLLPVESQQAVNAARITLASYRRQFIRGAELGVKTITRASAQVCLSFQKRQIFPELLRPLTGAPVFFPSVKSPISSSYIRTFQAVPEKSSFVEFTVQECPEGLTERGTCQRPTLDSDTEVIKTISIKMKTRLNHFTLKDIPDERTQDSKQLCQCATFRGK